MKISNPTSNYFSRAYATPPKTSAETAQTLKADPAVLENRTDSINLSDKTRDMQKIAQASEATASDRQKRVDKLKQQVDLNQYTVDADKLAEKMAGMMIDGHI